MTSERIDVDLGPGVRAFFTTRAGGVSTGPTAGLNLGVRVGDDAAHVRANRDIAAAWAGAPVHWAHQVHGVTVLDPAAHPDPDALTPEQEPEGDAWMTAAPGHALAVQVADCTPVLLADAAAGVIGAAHCGRQGLAAGVLTHLLAAMLAAGATPARLRAAIGPGICGRCYEVPAELRDAVEAAVPGTAATTSWGTPAIDIPAGVRHQLDAAGVREVQDVHRCTWEDEGLYSYRRAGGAPTGRMAGIIALG